MMIKASAKLKFQRIYFLPKNPARRFPQLAPLAQRGSAGSSTLTGCWVAFKLLFLHVVSNPVLMDQHSLNLDHPPKCAM